MSEIYVNLALTRLRVKTNPAVAKFFSMNNIEILHKRIIKDVNRLSGNLIDRQSDDKLYQVMYYLYSTFSQNVGGSLEIEFLNDLTVKQAVPEIIENIEAYKKFMRDSSQQAVPMERGETTSSKGENQLISNPVF